MDTVVYNDLEVMRQTLETNLLGTAATFHPFVDPMRARGSGRLVGVASVAASAETAKLLPARVAKRAKAATAPSTADAG